jgi:predicted nucleotidyltransferase
MEQDINLKKIKEVVLEILPGAKVYLFGSRARNTQAEWSDYDIMVVTVKSYPPREKISIRSRISKLLAKKDIPADILMNSEEEVQIRKDLIGHIVRTIFKEAIAL